jgi:predicted  nucleic acid-binding Zn-ribbon protein
VKTQTQPTERQRLEQGLEEAQQSLNEARAKLNQSEQDFVTVERQIQNEADVSVLAALQSKRDALATLQPRLRREVEKRQEAFDSAKNAIAQNESLIQEVQRNISKAPAVKDNLLRRKDQAEEDLRQAQIDLSRAEKAIESQAAEVRGYESQLMRLGGHKKESKV